MIFRKKSLKPLTVQNQTNLTNKEVMDYIGGKKKLPHEKITNEYQYGGTLPADTPVNILGVKDMTKLKP